MKKSHLIFLLFVLFTIVCMLLFPQQGIQSGIQALTLCVQSVIPSLFPFFVCSSLLIQLRFTDFLGKIARPVMQPLFRINGNGAFAVIIGLISGYPAGAKATAALVREGRISINEGNRLLAFCNNAGPIFLLGAVGSGMLGNPKLGCILYFSQFLASVTIGIFLRFFGVPSPCRTEKKEAPAALLGEAIYESIAGSVVTVLNICGFVVFFAVFLSFLESSQILSGICGLFSRLGLPEGFVTPLLFGLFEPANGALAAARLLQNGIALPMLLSAIVGWSGISVHFQVLGTIKGCGLSSKLYFCGKILQSLLAPLYTLLLLNLFPSFQPVTAPMVPPAAAQTPVIWAYAILGFALLLVALFSFLIFCFLVCAVFSSRNKRKEVR